MRISDWSSDVCSSDLNCFSVFAFRPNASRNAKGNSAWLNGWAVSTDIASSISTAFMARHYAGCLQLHKMRDGRVGGEPEANWMHLHRRGTIHADRATVNARARDGVTGTTWSALDRKSDRLEKGESGGEDI